MTLSRVFALSPEEIALINPNTGTLPIFRNRRDADLTAAIYRRIPVLWDETKPDGNPWGITVKRLFDMTDDSDLFRTRERLEADGWQLQGNVFTRDGKRMLPLYEAKMAHHFRSSLELVSMARATRIAAISPHARSRIPSSQAQPRYWIAEDGPIPTRRNGRDVKVPGVSERLAELKWEREWLCGWRDVTQRRRTSAPRFRPFCRMAAVEHKFP